MPRSMSSGWDRGTLRCSGTPKRRNAAGISPNYARPELTARALGPARNWPTASNMPLPKVVWRRCPPPRRPATASPMTMRFAQRTAEEPGSPALAQPGEALLDLFGRQPVVIQRILVFGRALAGLAIGMTLFHGLPSLVG